MRQEHGVVHLNFSLGPRTTAAVHSVSISVFYFQANQTIQECKKGKCGNLLRQIDKNIQEKIKWIFHKSNGTACSSVNIFHDLLFFSPVPKPKIFFVVKGRIQEDISISIVATSPRKGDVNQLENKCFQLNGKRSQG